MRLKYIFEQFNQACSLNDYFESVDFIYFKIFPLSHCEDI